MTLNRLTVCLIVLRLLLLEGCIIPVGQDTIGKVIGDADLAFIEIGVTTKSEVVERLGNDYLFFKEHNLFYYWWYDKTGFVWFIPMGAADWPGGDKTYRQIYAVYVQFDSSDHVKRFQRVKESHEDIPTNVKEWLEHK